MASGLVLLFPNSRLSSWYCSGFPHFTLLALASDMQHTTDAFRTRASEQARRLVDDWHSGGESSEVADGMGVLAFGRWHVLYTSVTSCPGPPGTEGGGRHCAVDERLKNAHSTDSLRLVVHPHDAWDRNLQVLEREVRANGSLWHDDLLLPFLPVSQAPI